MEKTVVYLCELSTDPATCVHRVCLPNNPAICTCVAEHSCNYRTMAVKPETCNPLHPDGCTGIPEPEIKKPNTGKPDPKTKRQSGIGYCLAA